MLNCSNCGQVNADGQYACSRCGAHLAAPGNFGNAGQNQFGQNQFGQNQPNFNQPNFNQLAPPVKKGMGCWKIAAMILIPLAVIGLIVVGIFGFLVTQTLQWKITEKWRLDSMSMSGATLPLDSDKTSVTKFNWDQTYFVDNNGSVKDERGTYRVVDENTIAMTGGAANKTVNFTVKIDGNVMTMTAVEAGVTISAKYTRVK